MFRLAVQHEQCAQPRDCIVTDTVSLRGINPDLYKIDEAGRGLLLTDNFFLKKKKNVTSPRFLAAPLCGLRYIYGDPALRFTNPLLGKFYCWAILATCSNYVPEFRRVGSFSLFFLQEKLIVQAKRGYYNNVIFHRIIKVCHSLYCCAHRLRRILWSKAVTRRARGKAVLPFMGTILFVMSQKKK